jgi:hypothetical protein
MGKNKTLPMDKERDADHARRNKENAQYGSHPAGGYGDPSGRKKLMEEIFQPPSKDKKKE